MISAAKRLVRQFALVAAALTMGAVAQVDTLRIRGTGAAFGEISLVAAAYENARPGTTVTALPSFGSGGGIKALAAGKIDMAVSARAMKDKEKASGLREPRRCARTSLAVVTTLANTADAITHEQLEAAYAGAMLNWPDGSCIPIVPRPQSQTDTMLLRDVSHAMAGAVDAAFARPGILMAQNDRDNVSARENTTRSLGVAALAQLASEGRALKILGFDGVIARAAMAADPGVLFAKDFHITNCCDASDAARGFLAFARSTQGRSILDVHAYFTFD